MYYTKRFSWFLCVCFWAFAFSYGFASSFTEDGVNDFASFAREDEVKRILLFGKTGAGKTSIIQMAHEHCRGAFYQSGREFIVPIVVGQKNIGLPQTMVNDATHSQTKDITSYREHNSEHQVFVELVDTQGLFDTDGISMLAAEKQLETYLAEHRINAVALVIPASDARITEQIKDMLSLLDRVFGDQKVLNHFVSLVTFSVMPNENIKSLLSGHIQNIGQKIFYFDNSCLLPPNPEQKIGGDYQTLVWDMHRKNFSSLIGAVKEMPALESTIFHERSKFLREAEELLRESHVTSQRILVLGTSLEKLNDDLQLIEQHGYKKWSCGYVGDNLSTSTHTTPIMGEKACGGPAGWFGGTKTFVSGYNTSTSCNNCGKSPGIHSADFYVNLRGQGETLKSHTMGQKSEEKASCELERNEKSKRLSLIEQRLQAINQALNETGSQRNYVEDLKHQLDFEH